MSAIQLVENVAHCPTDRAYVFDVGWLGTSGYVTRTVKRRRAATISLTLSQTDFCVQSNDDNADFQAVIFKPLVGRTVDFRHTAIISAIVEPNHPSFRTFGTMSCPGILPLPREAFALFDVALKAVEAGRLGHAEARRLFEEIINVAAKYLPAPKPLDPRIASVIDLINQDTDRPLEKLAAAVHLSYYRLSHLFAENIGMPLRSYQLWIKTHAAFRMLAKGKTPTEIIGKLGFNSLSHFYRVCHEASGLSPTFLLSSSVEMIFGDQ